ncbi:hypothetical protein GCM10011415_29280 [Salipiger pallidus]|uniref:Type I secretion C-terminal target domain (VC_A0849 subclass) n=2 Tax=Salipiger pallidus TaxID=1775170 RepID=A0A8J3EI00_9RHOB|nr:hypothetical protein GCM10011415_29280 [Salipiger pallidus]
MVLAPVMLSSAALAEERDEAAIYAFGNSLVHYLGDEAHSNAPYWMARLAEADGKRFALEGQWGFLRDFASALPPRPNWSIPGVPGHWDAGRGAFGDAGWSGVFITPANFIQYQPPDAPFEGENPTNQSPVGATLTLVDWLQQRMPDTPVYLYEGWAEMPGDFPPSRREYRRYHDNGTGDYAAWFDTYLSNLREARPDADIRMIPVARILSALLAESGPLAEVEPEALYVDADPHGTPTLYLLAGAIAYASVFETPPPAKFAVPDGIAPEVAAAWPDVAALIWDRVSASGVFDSAAAPGDAVRQAGASEGNSEDVGAAASDSVTETGAEEVAKAGAAGTETASASVTDEPLPPRGLVALPDPGAVPEGLPALGMGLDGISDWSTQMPFVDIMKTARQWTGHLPGQWGGVGIDEMRADGVLDDDGWPLRIPEGVERLEALILTDQPEESEHLRGTYRVSWDGRGDLELAGLARRVRYGEGEAEFFYSPGDGAVGLSISAIDPDDPIRNIVVVREDQWPLYEAGVIFNPEWIARIGDLRSLRFMDWMFTNGSPIQSWDERPRVSDYTWSAWGAPVEVMVHLANQVGADPWFTMPHMADDDYIRNFAEYVEARLDPRLKAYVEYSNEVWNHIFPQAAWAEAQADALWGRSEAGWMQFYAMRSAQVMRIWSDVFADASKDRLVRVVSTHTGWPGLEENILVAPLAYLTLGNMPVEEFDAYAVAGYFGYEMGGEEMAAQLDGWLDRSEAQAVAQGEAEGLQRVALREYVKARRFDGAIAPVALALMDGSLAELTDEIFPYHAGAAEAAGLRLVMYEGGTHVTAQAARVEDERLAAFFEEFNYTPEMAKLYETLLTGWASNGGTLFSAFVDVAKPSKWGSWGALRHLSDSNPRWDMLANYNATGPSGWEERDPQAFVGGVLRRAGGGSETLEGGAAVDILLGGPGDDVLVSGGGGDHLHGGAGTDHAVLPGTQADYSFARESERLIAEGPEGPVSMFSVETLGFADSPEARVSTDGL